jgi:serine/threonine-protein phosphatase 5
MDGITEAYVMASVESFRDQKRPDKKDVIRILNAVTAQLSALPSLVEAQFGPADDTDDGSIVTEETEEQAEAGDGVADHFNVCGDTHGQFYDLLHIFELAGYPSPTNPFLFNGDFVDRGSWSFEVVMTLFMFKLLHPDSLHLTRGNHESMQMNVNYGFFGEVLYKYDKEVMGHFTAAFNWLPLAATINGKVFVTHGGLFERNDVTLADIAAIDRNREPPFEKSLMKDLLWSDPQNRPGRAQNRRGGNVIKFGPDVTQRFLDLNGLDLIVRSHEVKQEGYDVQHGGNCVTIFSAPNYVDSVGNKGAFIRFGLDLKPEFIQFDAQVPLLSFSYFLPIPSFLPSFTFFTSSYVLPSSPFLPLPSFLPSFLS